MIRCPSCGTFNHDSQRVCRSCGSALPQTRRRCPECGALNPVGNLFCDRCNARLVDIEDITPASASDSALNVHTGVKGISLPMRPVTSDEGASVTGTACMACWPGRRGHGIRALGLRSRMRVRAPLKNQSSMHPCFLTGSVAMMG